MRTSFSAFCEKKLVAKATPTQSAVSLLVGVRLRTSFGFVAADAPVTVIDGKNLW